MIELAQVSCRQGQFELVDLDFAIASGEYAVLMGPSGCGKTTVLEIICGLRRVTSGKILVNETDVTHLPAARRGIGYVPQDRALFPTMRIDRQIEYGLIVRGAGAAIRHKRVAELAELTGISKLLNRYPRGLSGGECQRVALARALSFRPSLLCLDEPLSALDADIRLRLADLLHTIHRQEQITVLHVTHNAEEALRLGTANFRFHNRRIHRVENRDVENCYDGLTETAGGRADRRREINL